MIRWNRLLPLLSLPLVASCHAGDNLTSSCSGPSAYTAGATVNGTMGVNDCKGPDGSSGQLYTMTLGQQSNLALTVAATDFPPFLGLYTSGGKVIATNNTDTKIKVFLPAGSYQVFVASNSGKGGSFALSSPVAALAGCSSSTGSLFAVDIGITMKGASFSGSITSTDCGAANAKTHLYEMHLATNDTVGTSITVDHPAGLYLVNSTGLLTSSKEMSAAGTWTSTVPASVDGWYTLRIESRTVNGSSNLPLGYTIALK
jgi:hypothetical protein